MIIIDWLFQLGVRIYVFVVSIDGYKSIDLSQNHSHIEMEFQLTNISEHNVHFDEAPKLNQTVLILIVLLSVQSQENHRVYQVSVLTIKPDQFEDHNLKFDLILI